MAGGIVWAWCVVVCCHLVTYSITNGWLLIHSLTSALLNSKMPFRVCGCGNLFVFHHLRNVWWCMPNRWASGITRIKPSVGKVSNGAGWVFGWSLGVAVFTCIDIKNNSYLSVVITFDNRNCRH